MRVSRWGNSLAIRLPASVVEALGLKEGDDIEMTIAGTRTFVAARDDKRSRALSALRALGKPLPPGWRFDRDDAHER